MKTVNSQWEIPKEMLNVTFQALRGYRFYGVRTTTKLYGIIKYYYNSIKFTKMMTFLIIP